MIKKRRLAESMEVLLTTEPNLNIIVDNMVAEWGGLAYAELSVLVVYLKFLAVIHQNHHWVTKGDPYYGDHLLYQRLYSGVVEEIDSLSEKTIGLGSASNVDLKLQVSQLNKLVCGYGTAATIPQQSELARRSLHAELNFLKVTAHLVESLKSCGLLTRGLDNLLAGIEDAHEGHVYLLKQRTAQQIGI